MGQIKPYLPVICLLVLSCVFQNESAVGVGMMLGVEVDLATINWLVVTLGGALATAGTGIWIAGKRLAVFLKPHIERFFNSHNRLVDIASEQIPVMSSTLTGVSATLSRLSDTQDSHSEILQQQSDRLEKIRQRLEKKEILDAESDG